MMGILWVAIILGIVFLARYFKRGDAARSAPTGLSESAAEILGRRYANGELNREEFLLMMADLQKQE